MAAQYVVFFSPTKTSKKVACALAEGAGFADAIILDLTSPATRETFTLACNADDTLIFAFPVYAGRVPSFLQEPLARMAGNGAKAIPVAVYGNRDFDDALREAADILEERGFSIAAAATFIGEHSFTRNVAGGRPDAEDLETARAFGAQIAEALAGTAGDTTRPAFKGAFPYKETKGAMPFAPVTSDACVACGLCARVCPMGNINADDLTQAGANCIQCCACVKNCPKGAKSFNAEPLAGIIAFLEGNCQARKEPELFL